MSFNLTVRIFLILALCYYFWDITLGGSQGRAFSLTNVDFQELKAMDAEEVKQRYLQGENVSQEVIYRSYYYRGFDHDRDMEMSEHLEIIRYRLTFGPRLALVPVLTLVGKTASRLLPAIKDETDQTGYNTGLIFVGALALPSALFLQFARNRRPILAWSGTLIALFLLIQINREYVVGSMLFGVIAFICLPVMILSSWKLLSAYSRS